MPTIANADMSLSQSGRLALQRREGRGGAAGNPNGYYDDNADNCTYGTGTLAHNGPCTAAELARRVDAAQADAVFNDRVRDAEHQVRAGVPSRKLNQNQFDALVSAAYNSRRHLDAALGHVNLNNDAAAVADIRGLVYIHRHDPHGTPVGAPVRSQGLVNRRESEIRQFNEPVASGGHG